MSNNLKKFALKALSILHLRDGNDDLMYADGPDGQPDLNRPMRAHLYGPGTKQYAVARAEQSNRTMDRMKRKGKADLSSDEQVKENAKFLARCTAQLENVEYENLSGDDLHMAVYNDLELCFIPAQIDKFIGDTANFTAQPSTT
ncbi:hypothetical protein GJ700_12725 [Duganella sp. FT92W]|uniref:Uncharacterized protein n=1 Tax=Pseudoduganella rivuli TaxID=2666085 RepID=A0A7X2LU17_9BURK|nr:hypothetical protein [Pseudoduganella rivuli]MRV72572.1 hypothetical protein [Pseudoduganella rivuli]